MQPFEPARAPVLAWSDDLATGHPEVDGMHREFVVLVNALASAPDGEVLAGLQAVQAHANAHFDAEDRLMRRHAYPSAGCHLDEHQAVLNSLAEVVPLVAAGRFGIGRDLCEALADWFPRHTEHMDKSLTQWLAGRALGGSPLVFRRCKASLARHEAKQAVRRDPAPQDPRP